MPASNNGNSSGTKGSSIVQFYAKPRTGRGGGCISDENMAEIARRLGGSVEADSDSGYVRSTTPPNDLTATWVPVDANGNRVGNNRVYNAVTGQWVDDYGAEAIKIPVISKIEDNQLVEKPDGWYVSKKRFFIRPITVQGNGTVPINFPDLGVSEYSIEVIPTSDPGASNLRWFVESQTSTSVGLKFLNFDPVLVSVVNFKVIIREL